LPEAAHADNVAKSRSHVFFARFPRRPNDLRPPRVEQNQWLIIHGLAEGNDLAPPVEAFDAPLQQAQPAPCADDRRGSWRLRSFASKALRLVELIKAARGAVSTTRGADVPQSGQSQGSR
jgi:hypothetical protein